MCVCVFVFFQIHLIHYTLYVCHLPTFRLEVGSLLSTKTSGNLFERLKTVLFSNGLQTRETASRMNCRGGRVFKSKKKHKTHKKLTGKGIGCYGEQSHKYTLYIEQPVFLVSVNPWSAGRGRRYGQRL